jgi:hypothetical protein
VPPPLAVQLAALPKPATKLPPPLLLDDQGRQVDATGKLIELPRAVAAALAPGALQQQQQQQLEEEQRRREAAAAK